MEEKSSKTNGSFTDTLFETASQILSEFDLPPMPNSYYVSDETGDFEITSPTPTVYSLFDFCSTLPHLEIDKITSHPFFSLPVSVPDGTPDLKKSKPSWFNHAITHIMLQSALISCYITLYQVLLDYKITIPSSVSQAQNSSCAYPIFGLDEDKDSAVQNQSSDAEIAREYCTINNKILRLQRTTKAALTFPIMNELFRLPMSTPDAIPHIPQTEEETSMFHYILLDRLSEIHQRTRQDVLIKHFHPSTDSPKSKLKLRCTSVGEQSLANPSELECAYKLGYYSFGNRAFGEVLFPLPEFESESNWTPPLSDEQLIRLSEELYIYQKMESVFNLELTEMMSAMYTQLSRKYRKVPLPDASFFAIFNNLPNCLYRSIFVRYAFFSLEFICEKNKSKKSKDKAREEIKQWKSYCRDFVNAFTYTIFPKIEWIMLIEVFYMRNIALDFSSTEGLNKTRLSDTLEYLESYIFQEHIEDILEPFVAEHAAHDAEKVFLEQLCLCDADLKGNKASYFQAMLNATKSPDPDKYIYPPLS